MKKLSFIILFMLFVQWSFACTTAVISGKYTVDGRPLLWKHRDASNYDNKLMFFDFGKYDFVGLVNSDDTEGIHVWGGTNSKGFSIMNSASFNLKPDSDTTSVMDFEGIVMKKALAYCATIEDFQHFLDTLKRPIRVEANFGVIDAKGGAAFFETHNFGYTKFDANNPKDAPMGYIIRSNYSFTGKPNVGYGFVRYRTAENLFYEAAGANNLSLKFLLQTATRSLKNSLTGDDLSKQYTSTPEKPKFVMAEDYIPRFSSTASIVFQGVKEDEKAELTTMWTILGLPITSIAVPTWANKKVKLPSILTGKKDGNAPLCDKALALKNQCFPIKRGSGERYLNINKLFTPNNTGIMQKIIPMENKILAETEKCLKVWRKNSFKNKELSEFYNWLEKEINSDFKKEFNL